MEIPAQLAWVVQPNAEPPVAPSDQRELVDVGHVTNRLIRGIDRRLECGVDEGGDGLALIPGDDGDPWPLRLVRLNQDQGAVRFEVLPGSPEGIDHARDRDSSK
jgi:hypothetical protein